MYDRRVRLPDLLVSEGVVHAETVVEIFEAQALYGGSFDTNLLELGILDERRLLPYLERAFALQNRVDVTAAPALEAVERLPRRYAEQHRMVPHRLIGRTLDLVCADPSDLRALDEINFVTGCRLQVNIAIEARLADLLARGYGASMPARLANVLAGKQWLKPLVVRPGRAPAPRVAPPSEHAAPRRVSASIPVARAPSSAPAAPVAPAPAAPVAPAPVAPAPVAPAPVALVAPAPVAPAPAPVAPAPVAPAPVAPAPVAPVAPAPAPVAPALVAPAPVSPPPRAPEESITEQVLRAEPEALLPPLPARERPRTEAELALLLKAVSDRDQIPTPTLAYLSGINRVVLLRVRRHDSGGWELAGWDAAGALRRENLHATTLPLDRPSVFASVTNDVAPYEGALPRGQVEAAFLDQIGAVSWPATCFLAPVRVKGRVVSLLYADAENPGGLAAVREPLLIATRLIAETLVRVILVKKQG
jgi:hypothetical protein